MINLLLREPCKLIEGEVCFDTQSEILNIWLCPLGESVKRAACLLNAIKFCTQPQERCYLEVGLQQYEKWDTQRSLSSLLQQLSESSQGKREVSYVNFLSIIYGAAVIEVSGFMTRPTDSNYSHNTNATENSTLIDLVINASTQVCSQ